MTPDALPPDSVSYQLAQARGPIRVVIEQPRGSWLAWAFKWLALGIVALLLIGWMNAPNNDPPSQIQERWHSLSKNAKDKVAVISVEGTIFNNVQFVKSQIDRVKEDEDVKAIVLRVDSPGGTVTGSDYIYHQLKKLIKDKQVPMVVSMGSVAASGGYYVSMAAGDTKNTIFAEPTSWTGSIGVIIPHYDVTGLMDKIEIADDSIASHPLKMMGSPTRKPSPEIREQEQQILKGLVDASFEDFKEIVLTGRPALRDKPEVQAEVFTGRIFTAKQAKDRLLVDQLGFIDDAIERSIELAALEKKDVRVVEYHQPQGLLQRMLMGPQEQQQRFDLSKLADLTTPRALYLCTWLAR